jgi:L-arabinonolactonase
MHGRANDANADTSGNLVTGTLNIAPGPGAFWWFSTDHGWREIDADIGNANGPVVAVVDGETLLFFADTIAHAVYVYPYDPSSGEVGKRSVCADYTAIGGAPDGACLDSAGVVWSCVLNAGRLARITRSGIDGFFELPIPYPSDVTFGGADLDRLYLTSIAVDLGAGPPPDEARSLFVTTDLGVAGVPERRFRL